MAVGDDGEGFEMDDRVWKCTFDGCTSVFLSFTNLETHMMRGNHSLAPEKETITDVALGLFAARVETVGALQGRIATDEVMDLIERKIPTLLSNGWAQKSTQRPSFSPDAKTFVEETVSKCRAGGVRGDAKRIDLEMKAAKSGGKQRFSPSTMLTQKQVQGLINRFLLKLRDGEVDEVEADRMDETEADAWRAVEEGGVREAEGERERQREVSEAVPKKRLRNC